MGLKTATASKPTVKATMIPGRRNCHADMPPARITVSSLLRLNCSRAVIEPTSTAKAMRNSA